MVVDERNRHDHVLKLMIERIKATAHKETNGDDGKSKNTIWRKFNGDILTV